MPMFQLSRPGSPRVALFGARSVTCGQGSSIGPGDKAFSGCIRKDAAENKKKQVGHQEVVQTHKSSQDEEDRIIAFDLAVKELRKGLQ